MLSSGLIRLAGQSVVDSLSSRDLETNGCYLVKDWWWAADKEVYLLYKVRIRRMHGNWEETPLIKTDEKILPAFPQKFPLRTCICDDDLQGLIGFSHHFFTFLASSCLSLIKFFDGQSTGASCSSLTPQACSLYKALSHCPSSGNNVLTLVLTSLASKVCLRYYV